MAKLSFLGQAFVAAILLFSEGAEGSQSVTPSEESLEGKILITPEKTGRIEHQDVNQKSGIDLKLVEYFENEDATGENEKYPSSPRRYPVFYFHRSIWKNGERNQVKQDEGILARILRRLQVFGVDDNYSEIGEKNREDDNLYKQWGYNGDYHADMINDDGPRPTAAPTPYDTTFWNELPGIDDDALQNTQPPITDTEILLDRPHNYIILRIVLAVIEEDDMTEDDMKTIVHMAARALSLVLKKDKDIPFDIYDTVDFYEQDRGRNRTLEVTLSQPTPFRGQGVPIQQEASKSKEEEYLAKLFLDNIIIGRGEHNWWQLSAIYTVWTKCDSAPVKSRTILRKIEGMCGSSIENSIDQQIYWESLMNVGMGDPDLIIPGKIVFPNDKGIVDAKNVGDEYDMSTMRCPHNRPVVGDAYECSGEMSSALPSKNLQLYTSLVLTLSSVALVFQTIW